MRKLAQISNPKQKQEKPNAQRYKKKKKQQAGSYMYSQNIKQLTLADLSSTSLYFGSVTSHMYMYLYSSYDNHYLSRNHDCHAITEMHPWWFDKYYIIDYLSEKNETTTVHCGRRHTVNTIQFIITSRLYS